MNDELPIETILILLTVTELYIDLWQAVKVKILIGKPFRKQNNDMFENTFLKGIDFSKEKKNYIKISSEFFAKIIRHYQSFSIGFCNSYYPLSLMSLA